VSARLPLDLNDPATFPTRRAEDWRWTDLRRILREAPQPSPAYRPAPGGPFAALGGTEIAFGNGRTADGSATVRFVVGDPPPLGEGDREAVEGAALTSAGDLRWSPPSAGKPASSPQGGEILRLRFVTQAVGTGHQATAEIVVPDGAELLLLESHEGSGEGYVSNVRLSFALGANARLTRIVHLDDAADAIAVTVANVTRLGEGARFTQTVLTTGARLQRNETRIPHPGHGASVRLDGLYVLDGERHADLTTVVEHEGVGGETRQLTKGVVRDRARGVFQGRIVVAHGADQTDARMGHHALILGDHAEIDAKPELEIYADDVACAHGNTIGALDQDALFYAQSRGLTDTEARALLTAAFLGEVLDRIENEPVREIARGWLEARLDG
jgi:Fe-S cluster assembly protein SufD